MANTYSQIHIQTVFAVRFRQNIIKPEWRERLHKYITGIIQERHHKLLSINSMPDHMHIVFGLRPNQSISDLMQAVKGLSSKWINEQGFVTTRFEWQEGYGAFSYDRSALPNLISYVENQQAHHRSTTFREEYIALLKEFKVEYDDKYIFGEME